MTIKTTLAALTLSVAFAAQAQVQWPQPTQTTKPWTRWWWMGSAVNEAGLNQQINALSTAGFGGVQIVPIYGAKGYESQYISYLTPKWMGMLDYTVAQSKSRGMGVDISVGTGWPIGGPQVTVEDAAAKMFVQTYTIKAGEKLQEKIVVNDEKQKAAGAFLSAVTAYSQDGKAEVLTDKITDDGALNWSPQSGTWQVYALFVGKTGQKVKRAALGGEGYTLDHFSSKALGNYFEKFDSAFGNSNHGVRSFFNDSYEVYGANWTADFFNEFKKRQGYALEPYIKYLTEPVEDEVTARVKSDYRETMSALMLENFTTKFTDWAHSKKSVNTNQAHGSPANLLDLYAAVDIPESETFGSTPFYIPGLRSAGAEAQEVGPDTAILKFASSAAHVMGKPLTSNETFTWLTEHFKTSWSQCKPEVEQVFLSGINHVFYHGTTYTPADAPFPGWVFYASTNFVLQNSLWPHLKGLNEYITRCQSILQSGQPDNEVLAYWPVYDSWHNAKGLDMPFGIHQIDRWLCPTVFYENVSALQAKGYSLDYSSDKMLAEARVVNGEIKVSDKGAAYKVLVVSQTEYMPLATLQSIVRLANEGGTIVLQRLPKDVPGLNADIDRQKFNAIIKGFKPVKKQDAISEIVIGKGKIILANELQKALAYAKVQREVLADTGLKFIKRKIDGGKYYYIVNHNEKAFNGNVNLASGAKSVVLLDPQTGEVGSVGFTSGATTTFRLQLQPGESVFVKLSDAKDTATPKWRYVEKEEQPIVLNNSWKLHFTEGGPSLPSDKIMKAPQPWTGFTDDAATQSFSGTGIYSTTFDLKSKSADDYILKINELYESARVIVNGQDAGIIWSVPFELNIGKYLKAGQNTIEIEVCNLMANRIRYMDQKKMEWRKYHEINFVNIHYKDFDASGWEVMPSGLENVSVVPVKLSK
ncbi:glycoside hydrolase [Flavobacterium akiainvivens]|uniref:Glycoside hydrolase n=1 Tax=Flavobacterium akiainvivens TaxID=1202724 RepID=A0A0M8MLX2_9FLAO|nr:glycosyl hydrolase [Flavobacterium akiainvivens]KOS08228.1 glycoside hydrolase [Flavobacterium akiainvivens]SFQ35773.1 Glycosyl hydrolases family 2, sugar binding domain [Flavobacterium akiainvivens]